MKSQSELGVLDPRTLVVSGLGIIIDQSLNPDLDHGDVEVTPVDLIVRTHYYGLYFMNTLDVTDRLAFTVGGRYNLANIKLEDQLGDALNGDHTFQRFNPMLGATYKLAARGDGLCRLFGIQSGPDAGRAGLRRSAAAMPA